MTPRHFTSVLAELKRRGLDGQFELIATKHGVLLSEMMGPSRRYCPARGECYALLASRGWSLRRIADLFGRTHGGVYQALKLHEKQLSSALLGELRGLRKCGGV